MSRVVLVDDVVALDDDDAAVVDTDVGLIEDADAADDDDTDADADAVVDDEGENADGADDGSGYEMPLPHVQHDPSPSNCSRHRSCLVQLGVCVVVLSY